MSALFPPWTLLQGLVLPPHPPAHHPWANRAASSLGLCPRWDLLALCVSCGSSFPSELSAQTHQAQGLLRPYVRPDPHT